MNEPVDTSQNYISVAVRLEQFWNDFPPRYEDPNGGPDLPGWSIRHDVKPAPVKLYYSDSDRIADNTVAVHATLVAPNKVDHSTTLTIGIVDRAYELEALCTNSSHRLLVLLGYGPREISDAELRALRDMQERKQEAAPKRPETAPSRGPKLAASEGKAIATPPPERPVQTGATASSPTTEVAIGGEPLPLDPLSLLTGSATAGFDAPNRIEGDTKPKRAATEPEPPKTDAVDAEAAAPVEKTETAPRKRRTARKPAKDDANASEGEEGTESAPACEETGTPSSKLPTQLVQMLRTESAALGLPIDWNGVEKPADLAKLLANVAAKKAEAQGAAA